MSSSSKQPPRPHPDDEAFRARLTDMEYAVTRLAHTEPPFTGRYWNHWETGVYNCVCCGAPLFASEHKFDAGCGWPSYDREAVKGNVAEVRDTSHGMIRTEILCAHCQAHLGHVFPDGPTETGLRYCVNSASVRFEPETSPDPTKEDHA